MSPSTTEEETCLSIWGNRNGEGGISFKNIHIHIIFCFSCLGCLLLCVCVCGCWWRRWGDPPLPSSKKKIKKIKKRIASIETPPPSALLLYVFPWKFFLWARPTRCVAVAASYVLDQSLKESHTVDPLEVYLRWHTIAVCYIIIQQHNTHTQKRGMRGEGKHICLSELERESHTDYMSISTSWRIE